MLDSKDYKRPRKTEVNKEIESSSVITGLFDIAVFTIGIKVFVLLGHPVYRRWFLDDSDPDVR